MDTLIQENRSQENPRDFARAVIQNWHLVLILLSLITGIITSYVVLKNDVMNLNTTVKGDELQATVLNATVQNIVPQLSAANAKLDIILKHDGL